MSSNDLNLHHDNQMMPAPEYIAYSGLPLLPIDADRVAAHPSESGDSSAVELSLKLGERLLKMGLLNAWQLEYALEYQKENGGRLGDILVSLGYLDQPHLTEIFKTKPSSPPLGTMLLREGVLSAAQLDQALEFQKKSGGLLGDIIITMRMAPPDVVYRHLAIQNQLGRAGTKFDPLEAGRLPYQIAKKYHVCIVNRQNDRFILAVVKTLPQADLQAIETILDMKVEPVLASQHEIDSFLSMTYGSFFTDESIHKLESEMPQNSARKTFTMPQILVAALLGVALLLGCLFRPRLTLFLANIPVQLMYFGIAAYKMYILIRGLKTNSQIVISDRELQSLDEKELPVYTILVPIYKEARVIPDLLAHLAKLDYPAAKLDVRLLLEQDDRETIQALQGYDLPYYCTVITVPHSLPKTKPKACNYGLIRARGEYVVIYDAEDRPDPDQLKKAYLAFKKLAPNYICIQAKLNYYNSKQNILTKWFTQEYSMWFEILLPGVVRLRMPVPLGGTSNHFKTDAIKKVGAWDPYNVTEDADLGVRIFKEGYVTAVMDSRTWEEANSRLGSWLRQRSRWIKGYMQTWLVHMRQPLKLRRELGRNGFWGFQAVILGSVFLPLVNPLLWFMMIWWYLTHALWISQLFRGPIYYAALCLLFIGNFFFIYSNAIGMFCVVSNQEQEGKPRLAQTPLSHQLVKYALLSPIYWMLMSIAAYKALGQLFTKPFFWEKTPHGLSPKVPFKQ